jgi:hypothetical protein
MRRTRPSPSTFPLLIALTSWSSSFRRMHIELHLDVQELRSADKVLPFALTQRPRCHQQMTPKSQRPDDAFLTLQSPLTRFDSSRSSIILAVDVIPTFLM